MAPLSSSRLMMLAHSYGSSVGAESSAPAIRAVAHCPALPESSRAATTTDASQLDAAVTKLEKSAVTRVSRQTVPS